MPKFSPKQTTPIDVMVIGDHPSAYLAAALLRLKSKLRVLLVRSPRVAEEGRLVTINPDLFDLHPLLSAIGRKLNTTSIYGLHFLADHPQTRSEHRTKSIIVHSARFADVHQHLVDLAEEQGVETLETSTLHVHRVDDQSVHMTAGKHDLRPCALIVADELTVEQKSALGIPDTWGPDVVHRFSMTRCRGTKTLNMGAKMLLPMSLDLCGQLCWGWLIPSENEFQLMVEEPFEKARPGSGAKLLRHWAGVLHQHQLLKTPIAIADEAIRTVDLPLAGALAHEGVANRTLLIGPAGGFYSACGEEIYPSCWSALFAVDVLKKALKEKHLQDALDPFRQKWRTTLGDYLRGPQQNLRFLLPLVYRNPAMTQRLAEAILLSKSVVR